MSRKISAINKANRAKQKIYHTSGSKSILANGKELETVERFMEDPATHNHISSFDAVGRAFNEKEHSGRVCGLGFGPTPSQVFGSARSSQRLGSQSSIYTDLGFWLFTDGVLSVLNQIVSSSQLPYDVMADVNRLTQTFGGVQSSQHSHGDPPPREAPRSSRGDDQQSGEACRPDTTTSPLVDGTMISPSVAGSANQSGGASILSSRTGSTDDNVLSSTSSGNSDSDSDSDFDSE
ncbi:hypothetical protein LINPERPRIM_LOCUS31528 [Linum perenne]